MSKTKHAAPLFSEMHFVSSLSLEEAVYLIGQQASPEIPITITEIDSDTFKFKLDDIGVDIHGTLRRWQGTFTRLDCRSDVEISEESVDSNIFIFIILLFPAIIIIFRSSAILPVIVFISLLIFLIAMIVAINESATKKTTKRLSNANFIRRRDYILNFLIDLFKSHGQVSLDGSGLEEAISENPNFVIDELPQVKIQRK